MHKHETKSNTTGTAFPLPGADSFPPGIAGLSAYLQADPSE